MLPFNDPDAVDAALADRDIAAVIIEPIPHAVGVLLPQQEFLDRLRAACTRTDTVLIFDEIVTGFRHSLGGYQSVVGITPDLTTVGKAMANGYPIAALGGRADLMENLGTVPGGTVYATGTFNGHPAMAAAAVATIRKLDSEPVLDHVFALGERLRAGLTELYARIGQTATVTRVRLDLGRLFHGRPDRSVRGHAAKRRRPVRRLPPEAARAWDSSSCPSISSETRSPTPTPPPTWTTC